MKYFLLFFLLMSLNINAQDDIYKKAANPICSQNGLVIYYLNGVMNFEVDREESFKGILKRVTKGDVRRYDVLDENNLSFS